MFARQMAALIPSLVRQYRDAETISNRKVRLLREMLDYCRAHVPFYKDRAAYDLARIESLADLTCLPIITKMELRELGEDAFISQDLDRTRSIAYRTSGSTGQRVAGFHDEPSHDYHTGACFRRLFAIEGYWPTSRLSHVRPYAVPMRSFERLGLFRRHLVLSSQPVTQQISQLLANRPHVILAIPTYLREIARAITPAQLAELKKSLRAINTESELLTEPHRKLIEETFGVPVYDEYSAFEVLNVYYECPQGGRHIAEDRVHVEIVDENGQALPDGEEGQILVTNFTERGTPLIRYRIGDLGLIEKAPCACGRTFKTMRVTRGRTNDRIVLPDGRPLFWADIIMLCMDLADATDCFVHQDSTGFVRFYFIPTSRDPAVLEQARAKILGRLYTMAGQKFPAEAIAADQIPVTSGGKGAFVRSDFVPSTKIAR